MLKLIAEHNEEVQGLDAIRQLPGVVLVDCQAEDAGALQDAALLARLEDALQRIEADAACRLIVFHGLGLERSAVAGLPELRLYGKREQLLQRFRELAPPSVALVDGVCSGIHFELALGADACLASERSSFAVPELAQGHLPGMGVFRLARHIGLRQARRLLLLNGVVDAYTALAQGLADTVCPAASFAQQVAAIAAHTASNSMVATQLGRRLLEESYASAYEDSVGHFLAAQHRCYARLPGAAQ